MPSYYNHSSKNSSDQIQFSDKDIEVSTREINKLKVKVHKQTRHSTRLEIAQDIGKSVSYVDDLWKEIREEEEYKMDQKAEKHIQERIREYEIMKLELWEAWRESKKDYEKEKYESGFTSKGDIDKRTSESGGRLAKIDYMTEIRMINREIDELRGIKKMQEIHLNQQQNNFTVISNGPALVPSEHDAFTKKPKELTGDEFTDITEADAEEVSDEKTDDGPPEDISDF